MSGRKWTDEEIEILKNIELGYEELSEKLQRGIPAIKKKCNILQIKRKTKKIFKPWTKYELEIIKNNKLTYQQLSKIINRSLKSIEYQCSKLNIKRDIYHHFSDNDIKQLYNSKLTYKQLSIMLNKPINSIMYQCKKFNIKRHYGNNALYPYNDFFKKMNKPSLWYILGYWWADGNISKNLQNFSITSKDKEHLEDIRKIVGVFSSIKPTAPNKKIYTYNISQQEIVQDIINLGGVPKKSLVAKPPKNIPLKFILLFIVGLIDGDGWICLKDRNYPEIGFISTKEMSLWIHKFLGKPNLFHLKHPERSTNTWYSKYYGEKAQEIIQKLYLNNPKPYFLQRKVKKAKKAMTWIRKLKRNKPTEWNDKDIQQLYDNKHITYQQLSDKLNKPIHVIKWQCKKLNIKKVRCWENWEIEKLKDMTLNYKELSLILNRSVDNIRWKCCRLKIKRKLICDL